MWWLLRFRGRQNFSQMDKDKLADTSLFSYFTLQAKLTYILWLYINIKLQHYFIKGYNSGLKVLFKISEKEQKNVSQLLQMVTPYLWEGDKEVFRSLLGVVLLFLSFLVSLGLDLVSLQIRGSSWHRPLFFRILDSCPWFPEVGLCFILSIYSLPCFVFRISFRIRQGLFLQDETEKQLFTTFSEQRLLRDIVPLQGIQTYSSSIVCRSDFMYDSWSGGEQEEEIAKSTGADKPCVPSW